MMIITERFRASSTVVRHPELPQPRGIRLPALLAWLTTVLALGASLAGLTIDGVYAGARSTAEMFRGYDLVTAVVVVPGLMAAAHRARRGSPLAQLMTTSLLAYLVYTYAYYLFGTGFNDLFLLHAAVFGTGLFALIVHLVDVDAARVAGRFSPRMRVRVISGILGVLGVALAGMWVYFAVDNALTGSVPAGSRLVETDAVVRLGMALDLTLLAPLYVAAAVLLWRRAAWGYVLSAVALFGGILHQLSYVVAMPFQVAAGVPGAVTYDPAESVIVTLYGVATVLLVLGATSPSVTRSTGVS